MMRHTHRVRFGMAVAFGLLAAGTAFSDDGTDVPHRLVIDPGTFQSMPSAGARTTLGGRSGGSIHAGARTTLGSRTGGSIHAGPRILLRRPENDAVFRPDEPVTVHVEFLPAADGSAPDMATLNVRVRKGWFGKDITGAVDPYVRGAAIHVPELDFSGHTGNFRFEIRIRDYLNRESEVELRVRVGA